VVLDSIKVSFNVRELNGSITTLTTEPGSCESKGDYWICIFGNKVLAGATNVNIKGTSGYVSAWLEFSSPVLVKVSAQVGKRSDAQKLNISYPFGLFTDMEPSFVSCPSKHPDFGCPFPMFGANSTANDHSTFMLVGRATKVAAWRQYVSTRIAHVSLDAYFDVEILGVYDGLFLSPVIKGAEQFDYPTMHYYDAQPITVNGQELEVGEGKLLGSSGLSMSSNFKYEFAYNGNTGVYMHAVAGIRGITYTRTVETGIRRFKLFNYPNVMNFQYGWGRIEGLFYYRGTPYRFSFYTSDCSKGLPYEFDGIADKLVWNILVGGTSSSSKAWVSSSDLLYLVRIN